MSNRRALFPSTTNPHLPHFEEDDSAHHRSKHNFPDCQTEPDCGLKKHPVSQRSLAASDENRGFLPPVRLRREIPDLRAQGIVYRPLLWTADGRPHPAVTRSPQYAADIASADNKSLHRRWKDKIQIALLLRRAAMTRAVLRNISAREQWLLADLIDRAASWWVRAPPRWRRRRLR